MVWKDFSEGVTFEPRPEVEGLRMEEGTEERKHEKKGREAQSTPELGQDTLRARK